MEGVLKQTIKDFSKKSEILQTIFIALFAFLIPTFLAKIIATIFGAESSITNNSQIIVGSTVNTILILSALNLKGFSKILLVVTMPSVSTIFSGYIFKSASVFMVYMIPAIWIGNLFLILSFKYLMLHKNLNYFLSSAVGIIGKVAIIFGLFTILKMFSVFPVKVVANLQNAMGILQLITATIGCIIAFTIYKLEDNNKNNKE